MSLEVELYPLGDRFHGGERVEVYIPEGAIILSLQWDRETLYLLVAADMAAPCECRRFAPVCSDQALGDIDPANYIGTVKSAGRRPIWHVFEV